jgi:hypothetical protein
MSVGDRMRAVWARDHELITHETAGGHVFTRKSRAERAREQMADTAATVSEQLRERIAPAVALKARDAKTWAAPRVERGVERGLEVAAPRVESAVEKVSPKVDAARDKLVEDLLPRLVVALNAAAAAGHAATDVGGEARARGKGAAAVLSGAAVAKPKRRRGRRFLLFAMIAAAVSAAVAVVKSRSPKDDPWAIPSTTYPGTNATGPAPMDSSATGTATTEATTASSTLPAGGAHTADVDLRDSATGASTGTADLPGMSSASEAGKDAVEESSAKKQGDPLDTTTDSTTGGKAKKKP